jgi:putative SOS response-associated peptidase YedK
MCNEYRFRQSLDQLVEEFSKLQLPLTWSGGAPNLEPRDSIRPTDPAPVIVGNDGGARLEQLRWGFPRPKGGPIINFRSEGRRFPVGRCLLPTDGFYEFTGPKAPKSKWLFTATDGNLFCIAGLVRDDRFTMLTIDAGPDIAPYHDREIVILPREHWTTWLGAPDVQPPLNPAPAGTLQVRRIR